MASFLDKHNIKGNYKELGLSIFHNNIELMEEVNRLQQAYDGGGSPGSEFLQYLQTQDYKVRDLLNTAKQLRRDGIIAVFENLNAEQLNQALDGLTESINRRVGKLLDLRVDMM